MSCQSGEASGRTTDTAGMADSEQTDSEQTTAAIRAVYEHPWIVRFWHWANAVTLSVMVMRGLQIFMAFPSFGEKIPQRNVVDSIPDVYRLGGWLGGALQWHFTFMWLFAGGGVLY